MVEADKRRLVALRAIRGYTRNFQRRSAYSEGCNQRRSAVGMKIKKGDTVLIITGKDRTKKGKVIHILPKENRIIVEGLNIVKKHVRPKRTGEKGQRVEVPRPLDVSNVKLICPKCKKTTRIGYRLIQRGHEKKVRFCKKCGQEV